MNDKRPQLRLVESIDHKRKVPKKAPFWRRGILGFLGTLFSWRDLGMGLMMGSTAICFCALLILWKFQDSADLCHYGNGAAFGIMTGFFFADRIRVAFPATLFYFLWSLFFSLTPSYLSNVDGNGLIAASAAFFFMAYVGKAAHAFANKAPTDDMSS